MPGLFAMTSVALSPLVELVGNTGSVACVGLLLAGLVAGSEVLDAVFAAFLRRISSMCDLYSFWSLSGSKNGLNLHL